MYYKFIEISSSTQKNQKKKKKKKSVLLLEQKKISLFFNSIEINFFLVQCIMNFKKKKKKELVLMYLIDILNDIRFMHMIYIIIYFNLTVYFIIQLYNKNYRRCHIV